MQINWRKGLALSLYLLLGIFLSIENRFWFDKGVQSLVYATFIAEFILAAYAIHKLRGLELILFVLGSALLVPSFLLHNSLPLVRLEQLSIALYVLKLVVLRKKITVYKPVRLWFIVFAVSMSLSILYATVILGVPPALRDLWEVGKLISYLFFFLLAYNELPNASSLRTVTNVFIGIMILGNVFAVLQYYGPFGINWWLTIFYAAKSQFKPVIGYAHRIVGLLPNPNDYGMLNVLFLVVMLKRFFTEELSKGKTIFYVLVLALAYRGNAMTLSRSALVTSVLTFIALIYWLRKRGMGKNIGLKAAGVVAIALTMYLTLSPIATDRMHSALNVEEDTSIQGRFLQYSKSVGSLKDSPIFGWGPSKEYMSTILDNDFLLLMRRYGLLGLSIYLLLYWKVYSHARILRTRDENVAESSFFLIAGMVGLMAYNIPAGTANNMQFLNWYWLMVGSYFAAEKFAQQAESPQKQRILMLLSNPYTHDPRVQIEAKTLAEAGHQVTVLCWDRSGENPAKETDGRVEIIRIFKPSQTGSGLKQLPAMLKFWRSGWLHASQELAFDAVHAHDFDTLPLGYVLANDRFMPLVYDAHESYVDMVGARFPGWLKNSVIAAENFLLRRSEAVITVGHILREELLRRGARQCVLVGNWKDLDDFKVPEAELMKLKETYQLEGKLVVSYLGGLAAVRNVLPLVEAVAARPQVALLVAGSGETAPAVKEAAGKYPNIYFLGQIPAHDIPLYTLLSDVVYYGIDPSYPNAKYSAPNKLYEAMAAGKALLVSKAGEVGPTVDLEKAGVVLNLDDDTVKEIGHALDILSNQEILQEFKGNSLRAGRERYNWKAASQSLTSLYRDLAR